MGIDGVDYYAVYTTPLEKVEFGKLFLMLNYQGTYMRVRVWDNSVQVVFPRAKSCPFNDDGVHVPILEIATGEIIWMAKTKPCRVM